MKVRRFLRATMLFLLAILVIGYCIPQNFIMPVHRADRHSYDQRSFWYYPWGKSVTHKGVDIFGKKGTDVLSATTGLVIFKGELSQGGNVLLVLGPKWRFHYYAHLDKTEASNFEWLRAGEKLGTVGNSGNAAGKPSHLHYSIVSLLPRPWCADGSKQGWKKMFFVNPIDYLNQAR